MTITDFVKTGWNKIAKPVLATAAVLGTLTFMTPKIASAQIEADTLWATGILITRDIQSGSNIGLVDVTMRPHQVQMYTPDVIYNYTTGGSGLAPFEVIAYIDSTTDVTENVFENNTHTWVSNNTLNIELPSDVKQGEVSIYDIAGRKIGTKNIQGNKSKVSINNLAQAAYVYHIITPQGETSNLFTKTGVGTKKDEDANRGFKFDRMYDAEYWVSWEKEGFESDSILMTFQDGDNGPQFIYLSTGGSGEIPQHQWLEGQVIDKETGSGLEGTLVQVFKESNNQLLGSAITNFSGYYEFSNPIPAGTDVYFKVDKDEDYYAYDGSVAINNHDNYQVPNIIEIEPDTINDNMLWVMHKSLQQVGNTGTYISVPSENIRQMIGNTSDMNIEAVLDALEFYLGNSMSESQKQGYRANTGTLENHIAWPNLFTESSTPLNQGSNYDPYNPTFAVGINVEQGSNATSTDDVLATTPLGNMLTPVYKSDMTLAGINYLVFVHEHGRSLGINEVGFYSVMRADSPAFTNEDKVMFKLALIHFADVYNHGKAYFGLSSIVNSSAVRGNIINSVSNPFKETSLPSVEYNYVE